jgi:hypothetical protein
MARRRKAAKKRRKPQPMIKVRAMAEALMAGNLVTQNLMGGNVLEVLLGDLNAQGGTGTIQQLMGPQPGVITIKEVLTGSMNTTEMTQNLNRTWSTSIATSATSPLDAIAANFQANVGNIIVGGVMQTAGWRIFNKVTAKSVRRANAMIRRAGLGSTIQI